MNHYKLCWSFQFIVTAFIFYLQLCFWSQLSCIVTWIHQGLVVDFESVWQSSFPYLYKVGTIGNKGLRREEKNKFGKKMLPPVRIEPWTSYDSLSCIPDWANLASVNWGTFNFTFLVHHLSFWDHFAEINRTWLYKDPKSLSVTSDGN